MPTVEELEAIIKKMTEDQEAANAAAAESLAKMTSARDNEKAEAKKLRDAKKAAEDAAKAAAAKAAEGNQSNEGTPTGTEGTNQSAVQTPPVPSAPTGIMARLIQDEAVKLAKELKFRDPTDLIDILKPESYWDNGDIDLVRYKADAEALLTRKEHLKEAPPQNAFPSDFGLRGPAPTPTNNADMAAAIERRAKNA